MTIYTKRMNNHQRKALKDLESVSGFEPMYQDDFDEGLMTFKEV